MDVFVSKNFFIEERNASIEGRPQGNSLTFGTWVLLKNVLIWGLQFRSVEIIWGLKFQGLNRAICGQNLG